MLSFYLKDVVEIVSGEFFGSQNIKFDKIITDSRHTGSLQSGLFVAILGLQHDGHNYINELYKNGTRAFLVSKDIDYKNFPDAAFVKVKNTIEALHKLASHKRNLFNIDIIGITGSNGKTIVKEWLNWILNNNFKITHNPKSYNSQVGVPLSVWLLNSDTELGIFEAGISEPNEMNKLEEILKPTIGIITNIGTAHQANFKSLEQKAIEKLNLFKNTPTVIYNADDKIITENINKNPNIKKHITWSENGIGLVNITSIEQLQSKSIIHLSYDSNNLKIEIPYTDKGSIQNAVICFCTLLALDIQTTNAILKRFESLPSIEMRLEMLSGIHNSVIINDSYNSDINSLEIALDYLNQKKANRRSIIIISDIMQALQNNDELYKQISILIKEKNIQKFIGIGTQLKNYKSLFAADSLFFENTEEFLNKIDYKIFHDSAILIKGARDFKFEKISNKLQAKNHETVIEIDLSLIKHNLNFFRSKLKPETKIMAMVKAFSYGSGYLEIAGFLQHNRIDYLTVAFTDEGIELREGGIEVPIMVMNANLASLHSMIEFRLEPEIYSITILRELIKELESRNITNFPIHVKLDTGMHRLGLTKDEIEELCYIVNKTNSVEIKTVFTHLVGSDNSELDYFTREQAELFSFMYKKIVSSTKTKPMRHILNSAGILRFPEYDFEMVRLGIGLYGLMPEISNEIIQVSTFKSVISQTHNIVKGESVSYNRSGKTQRNSKIATIPVGYADGLDRRLGNGNWYFYVNSKKAYTIGNICMDMCMIDITDIDAEEGDEVIVFGKDNSICQMAGILNTIPYEIITGISQRVKRIYFEE